MAEASSKSGSAEMEDTDKEEAAEHDEPLCAAVLCLRRRRRPSRLRR